MNQAPDDTVAWVTVRLHAHGQCSISGTLGERKLALQLLAHAADAVRRQVPKAGEIYVPNSDVDMCAPASLTEIGDLAPRDRGDA